MKNTFFKKIVSTILIGVLALSFSACRDTSSQSGTKKEKNSEITVRIGDMPGFYPIAIAQTEGFFEEELEGLNAKVEIIEFPKGGPALTESFTAKEVDFGLLGDLPLDAAVANGTELEIIAWGATKGEADVLVTSKDSDINSVKDLKGKKVGVAVGQINHGELIGLLEKNGLSVEDVELVNLAPKDILTSLESGNIDAGMNYIEKVVTANENGGNIRTIDTAQGLGFSNIIFAGRTEFIEENPEIAQALIKAIDKANKFAADNKEQAIKDVYEFADGNSESAIAAAYDVYDYHVAINEEEESNIQNVLNFAIDNSLITTKLKADDVINKKFLESAGLN